MKRNPMPSRRTPLARTAGLPRTAGLSRAVGLAAAGAARAPLARRDTGPSARTRRAVYERDGWCCACCGTPVVGRPHSAGHRKRRSQGGTNDTSNLLTFLGLGVNSLDPDDHHARIDSRRDPSDEAKGYTVRSHRNPLIVPVMIFSPHGSGLTAWLSDDGRYLTEEPEGIAA